MRLEVEFDKRQIRALERRQENSREFLHAVADHLAESSRQRFRAQRGPDGSPWPARKIPNVAGIVKDLAAGKQPDGKRFRGRPALVDSGNLRDTIRGEVRGRWNSATIEVIAPARYSARMQEGGESGILPGAKNKGPVRSGLKKFLAGAGKRWKDKLGWLFGVAEFKVRVPPRPFLGLSREDDQWLEAAYGRMLKGEAVTK